MGKFATYRKRGSVPRGGLLPPPGPSDWEFAFSINQLRARFVVTKPVGAANLWVFGFNASDQAVGFTVLDTKDGWGQVLYEPDSETYHAWAEWRDADHIAVSGRSAPKFVTV
jgi:hypothetical protein